MTDYVKWLREGLGKPGKDMKVLAQKMKKHPTAIYKMLDGTRAIKAKELAIISAYIGPADGVDNVVPQKRRSKNSTAIEQNTGFVSVIVDGAVEAGAFREADYISQVQPRTFVTTKDNLYPNARHVAYMVAGDSMTGERIYDGDTIVCVDFDEAGAQLVNGMKVVIEQDRDGLLERSVKSVAVYPDRIEFQPRSDIKVYKPVILPNKGRGQGDTNVRVLALVRRVIRDI